jgi:membrane-associated phospholipid phosphatase
MQFFTDFADQAVVLPLALAVAVVLAAMGWRRGALVWLGVVGTTLGAILALKLGFMACGPVFGPWDLHSPSGHTAAASVLAGGFVTLLAGSPPAALAVSVLAAAMFGFSRVELGDHSLPEVLIGAAIGIAGAVVLSRLAGRPPAMRPLRLIGVVVVVALLLHGGHLQAEQVIWRFAEGRLDFVPACRTGGAKQIAAAAGNPAQGGAPAGRASGTSVPKPATPVGQDRP